MIENAAATAERMRAIAAELAAAGLDACLHESRASADVTAVARRPGHREIEVTVDEDSYVELRYWHAPGAAPAQVSGTITSAIDAITHNQ